MSKRNTKAPRGWRWTGYVKKTKCERCPNRKTLVVHHKDRDKTNNEDHANLETLCRKCHAQEHSAEIAERQRDPEVNARRGTALSIAKTGKAYPNVSASVKEQWKGALGEKLRAKHASPETRERHRQAALKREQKKREQRNVTKTS